jgi:hypothetical protein
MIELCVCVCYLYIIICIVIVCYANYGAPVRHKICVLYVEKSTSSLDPKCASYIWRINQSYSDCRMCKSFAGL